MSKIKQSNINTNVIVNELRNPESKHHPTSDKVRVVFFSPMSCVVYMTLIAVFKVFDNLLLCNAHCTCVLTD